MYLYLHMADDTHVSQLSPDVEEVYAISDSENEDTKQSKTKIDMR